MSEVQLTESTAVISSPDDLSHGGETGSVHSSSDIHTEDSSNVVGLSDEQLAVEVAAVSEGKPAAHDDANTEHSSPCAANDEAKRSTPEKADSDASAECSRMTTTKPRGGRSYQESRRSKKTAGEQAKSISGSSKSERTREIVDAHGPESRCLEQKGKGDVRDAGMQEEDSLKHIKDSCHPTCDGDQPASVNVIIDEHDMRKRYASHQCCTKISGEVYFSVNNLKLSRRNICSSLLILKRT